MGALKDAGFGSYVERRAADLRRRVEAALAKPLPLSDQTIGDANFSPWGDLIVGVDGMYASESDVLMIEALEAVRDRTTFDFIERRGFVAEFAMYVLSGNGLTDYGTSPRGGFPARGLEDLWQAIIDKWRAYAEVVWREDEKKPPALGSAEGSFVAPGDSTPWSRPPGAVVKRRRGGR